MQELLYLKIVRDFFFFCFCLFYTHIRGKEESIGLNLAASLELLLHTLSLSRAPGAFPALRSARKVALYAFKRVIYFIYFFCTQRNPRLILLLLLLRARAHTSVRICAFAPFFSSRRIPLPNTLATLNRQRDIFFRIHTHTHISAFEERERRKKDNTHTPRFFGGTHGDAILANVHSTAHTLSTTAVYTYMRYNDVPAHPMIA